MATRKKAAVQESVLGYILWVTSDFGDGKILDSNFEELTSETLTNFTMFGDAIDAETGFEEALQDENLIDALASVLNTSIDDLDNLEVEVLKVSGVRKGRTKTKMEVSVKWE